MLVKRGIVDRKIKNAGNWIFVYGRRKTGKTYYIRNFTKWDEYFFVTREGSVIYKDETLTFDEFFILFKHLFHNNKKIIVDEFHRLPDIFLDYIHSISGKGKIVLVSSTLWLSKKLLQEKSPILGLFYEMPFSIIDERDILINLKNRIKDKKEIAETAVYLREPILIPHYKHKMRRFISNYIIDNKMGISGLIGEIFREEERELTKVYEGILRAVSMGKNISSEISSTLFSRKLIKKDNPALIQGYLTSLINMGILKKENVWKKKKFSYKHISPLLDLFFYSDEKYGILEREVEPKFIEKVVDEKLPFHMEEFIKALASKTYGLAQIKIEEPETDLALMEFKKLRIIGEVKWKKITNKEVKEIENKLSWFDGKKLLIVPEKKRLESKELQIMEPLDFLKGKGITD